MVITSRRMRPEGQKAANTRKPCTTQGPFLEEKNHFQGQRKKNIERKVSGEHSVIKTFFLILQVRRANNLWRVSRPAIPQSPQQYYGVSRPEHAGEDKQESGPGLSPQKKSGAPRGLGAIRPEQAPGTS